MPETKLLDSHQAAKMVGISRSSFIRWTREGHAPAGIKLGPRAIRWHVADLEEFIEQRRAASAAS